MTEFIAFNLTIKFSSTKHCFILGMELDQFNTINTVNHIAFTQSAVNVFKGKGDRVLRCSYDVTNNLLSFKP